jgi:ligand-binding sensor domain-containing protein
MFEGAAAYGSLSPSATMVVRSQIVPLMLGVALTLEAAVYASEQATPNLARYRVTSWTTEHDLPQNTVDCLLQTHEGYLWIGTRYGLARYDGVRLVDFSAELTNAEEDYLDIRGLAEDADGRIWLHTPTALVCYTEGRFTKFSLEESPGAGELQSICASRNGGIWVARRKVLFYLANGQISRSYSMGTEIPHFLHANHDGIEECLEDSKGNLWVQGHGFQLFHLVSDRCQHSEDPGGWGICG